MAITRGADTAQAAFLAIYQRSFGNLCAGYNAGIAAIANDDGDSHHAEVINTISISRRLIGPLSGYVEFFTSVPTTHSNDRVGTVDAGVLWLVAKNFQVDAGINACVTRAAMISRSSPAFRGSFDFRHFISSASFGPMASAQI